MILTIIDNYISIKLIWNFYIKNIEMELYKTIHKKSISSVFIGANVVCHTILESNWEAEKMCESGFLICVGIPR